MEVYWIATQIITASQAGATEEEKKIGRDKWRPSQGCIVLLAQDFQGDSSTYW